MSAQPASSAAGPVTCSVVIPTFNRAQWLPACVDSVRKSGAREVEILIVDDGSTDDTPEVVARLGEGVQYLFEENAGEAAARNHGARHARGRYLAFLDSDDQWLPDGHQRIIDFLESHPEVAVGFGDALVGNQQQGYRSLADLAGHDGFRQASARQDPTGFRILAREPLFCGLTQRVGFSTCAFVVRRAAFDQVGGFDEAIIGGPDYDLWLRLAVRSTFAYYVHPVVTYEKHPDSITGSWSKDFLLAEHLRTLRKLLDGPFSLTVRERGCVRERLAELMYQRGYLAFEQGDLANARARFAECLRSAGPRPGVLFYWGSSWLPPEQVQRLRAIKQRIESVRRSKRREDRGPANR